MNKSTETRPNAKKFSLETKSDFITGVGIV